MKKITKKQEKNLRNNLEFLGNLNNDQRKYVLSLMIKGIYTFDKNKI